MDWLKSTIAITLLSTSLAHAEIVGGKVKIGVLTDMSGPYSIGLGSGVTTAVKMAVEEFGGNVNGSLIEVVSADHQNKPDVGALISARWYDADGVNVIADVGSSAVAFAVLDLAKAKNKMVLLVSTGSDDFTGKACAPDYSVHWLYDSYQLGASIGTAANTLGKKWYILNADYSFGRAMSAGITSALQRNGATVAGSLYHPLGTTDFSSYILQVMAANPDALAITSGADDIVHATKSAREFNLKARLVGIGLDTPTVIKAMTLQASQGMFYVSSWVRRDDDETKAFVKKFMEIEKREPSAFQVGNYSAVRSYLKAVQATNSTDPKTVTAKMRETPIRDILTQDGYLRPDGRMVHSVALMQIKKPEESQHEWDLSKKIMVLKGEDVFRPLGEGGCPSIK